MLELIRIIPTDGPGIYLQLNEVFFFFKARSRKGLYLLNRACRAKTSSTAEFTRTVITGFDLLGQMRLSKHIATCQWLEVRRNINTNPSIKTFIQSLFFRIVISLHYFIDLFFFPNHGTASIRWMKVILYSQFKVVNLFALWGGPWGPEVWYRLCSHPFLQF